MSKIVFSNHALLRMATYGFSTETIIQIIENPEMILSFINHYLKRRMEKNTSFE